MKPRLLMLLACLATAQSMAAEPPAAGKFVVATHELQAPTFGETVILLLAHGRAGAVGLIVNRPTATSATEILDSPEILENYDGPLFFGGPVEIDSLRALLRTDDPPDGAIRIIEHVYVVPLGLDIAPHLTGTARELRFYVGYSGWGPGQLEAEIARGSWRVISATEELVFSEDARRVWPSLVPPRQYQVALPPTESPTRTPGFMPAGIR